MEETMNEQTDKFKILFKVSLKKKKKKKNQN